MIDAPPIPTLEAVLSPVSDVVVALFSMAALLSFAMAVLAFSIVVFGVVVPDVVAVSFTSFTFISFVVESIAFESPVVIVVVLDAAD